MIRFLGKSALVKDPAVRTQLVVAAKREHAKGTEALNEFVDILTPAEVKEVLR